MAEKQSQSSWWGYASNAWSSIQETAKDFTDSLQAENKETIEQIKDTVDSEKISNQISNATTSINTFLNTTLQSINTDKTDTNSNNKVPSKKQISPKPFEKERATYAIDPCSTQQHKEKYNKFIETELGLNDDEICLKGRQLLEINSAIRAYFEQLVPNDVDEVTFWKRYFYWRYQTQLREILISRHTSPKKVENEQQIQEDIKQDVINNENENEEDVQLGDCENAKIKDGDHNQDENIMENMKDNDKEKEEKKENVRNIKGDDKGNKNRNNNGNGTTDEQSSTSDGGSGGKFSETSWTEIGNQSGTNITNTEESIANVVVDDDKMKKESVNDVNVGNDENEENDKGNKEEEEDLEQEEEEEEEENETEDKVKDGKEEEDKDKNVVNEEEEEESEDWADWD